MPILSLNEINVNNKHIALRVDFNVPIENGKVKDDFRLKSCLPTIKKIIKEGGRVSILSHLGRPQEGHRTQNHSLKILAPVLSKMLGLEVIFVEHWIDGFANNKVSLLENVRFLPGESDNDETLGKKMATLFDIFVNDAFATAHREQASTCGIAKHIPVCCAGPLFIHEIDSLNQVLKSPMHPIIAIVGGSKVSTKIGVLKNLSEKVDFLIVGGGIANTLLRAKGVKIGKSLYEHSAIELSQDLLKTNKNIVLPTDFLCGKYFQADEKAELRYLDNVQNDDLIMDFGPKSIENICGLIKKAKTILWNGPVGVFEFNDFATGTRLIAESVSASSSYSVAGGGDTIAAINKFKTEKGVSYISTAGGAFIEYVEGKKLPAIEALKIK